MNEVVASYFVTEEGANFEKKAESIALGLTVGSWTTLPLIEQQQLKKHKGKVVQVAIISETEAKIDIAYPAVNFSSDIPAILTTVFGKLSLDGKIRLVDLQLSQNLDNQFPGPRFGIEGIRKQLQVFDRPLLMSIFKGVIGRDISFLSEQLRAQASGGVDLVKDDEILFDQSLAPFEERVKMGRQVLNEVYEETGHRTLYAVNLTGRTFELLDKAKRAKALGADALLFNVFTYGLDVLQALRESDEVALPIMTHPSFSGAIIQSSRYGVSHELLLGKLPRLAGADFSLFPSPYGSVALEQRITEKIKLKLTEASSHRSTFPVPSAGIHPGLVPLLYRDFGIETVINAGGGVHGHPGGAVGGGRAFRQAIDAAVQGIKLTEAQEKAPELSEAIHLWGSKEVVV